METLNKFFKDQKEELINKIDLLIEGLETQFLEDSQEWQYDHSLKVKVILPEYEKLDHSIRDIMGEGNEVIFYEMLKERVLQTFENKYFKNLFIKAIKEYLEFNL